MTEAIQYRLDGAVAVITMDDGKANALSPASITALDAALDRAEEEAKAVVLAGRPGRFAWRECSHPLLPLPPHGNINTTLTK